MNHVPTKVYTRYRFLQRETRWKGLEDSLDECIDESVRTLDQVNDINTFLCDTMCFVETDRYWQYVSEILA